MNQTIINNVKTESTYELNSWDYNIRQTEASVNYKQLKMKFYNKNYEKGQSFMDQLKGAARIYGSNTKVQADSLINCLLEFGYELKSVEINRLGISYSGNCDPHFQVSNVDIRNSVERAYKSGGVLDNTMLYTMGEETGVAINISPEQQPATGTTRVQDVVNNLYSTPTRVQDVVNNLYSTPRRSK